MTNLKKTARRVPLLARLYRLLRLLPGCFGFAADLLRFGGMSTSRPLFKLRLSGLSPCIADKTTVTDFDRHYIFHPAWAARILAETRPVAHVDLSSSLTFCTMVSAFIPTSFYDYRPADLCLSGLSCGSADLLALPFEDNSIPSLSCMHVIEHIGLGRYGDPLDPDGDLQAISELKRVVAPGGTLLLVVPVGAARLMFNAHRIYSYDQIIDSFTGFTLQEFALVPDDGWLVRHAEPRLVKQQEYGCGCFRFEKNLHREAGV